jgi:hypothetical protein
MPPTSNGQVTSRDLRQQSIKTLHIVDEAVTTPKIPDLAITYPDKLEEPLHIQVFESEPGIDVGLTTTPQELTSVTVDIPAWVGQVFVLTQGFVESLNSGGGDHLLAASVRVNDEFDGAGFATVVGGDWGQAIHFEEAALAAPGSSIEVSIYGHISSGTSSNDFSGVWGLVLGQR